MKVDKEQTAGKAKKYLKSILTIKSHHKNQKHSVDTVFLDIACIRHSNLSFQLRVQTIGPAN